MAAIKVQVVKKMRTCPAGAESESMMRVRQRTHSNTQHARYALCACTEHSQLLSHILHSHPYYRLLLLVQQQQEPAGRQAGVIDIRAKQQTSV